MYQSYYYSIISYPYPPPFPWITATLFAYTHTHHIHLCFSIFPFHLIASTLLHYSYIQPNFIYSNTKHVLAIYQDQPVY